MNDLLRQKIINNQFWAKVDKTGDCWLWRGGKTQNGYGRFRKSLAHRYSYSQANGDIPKGLQLDHLCRIRSCVRPDHLEPVTAQINTLRSDVHRRKFLLTKCRRGLHLWIPENIYKYPTRNAWTSKLCRRIKQRDYDRKRRALKRMEGE